MRTKGWIVFAIAVLCVGFGVLIPTILNLGTPVPGSQVEEADYLDPQPLFQCYVPMFPDEGVRIHYHERIFMDKCVTRDDYVRTVHDTNLQHFTVGEHYESILKQDNLPSAFADEVKNAILRCEKEMGHSYTDYQKAVFVYTIVSTGVHYRYDNLQYGVTDYVASPLETLYLGYGDCEDVSILFVSICTALGLDAALIIFDGHVAGGAKVDGAGWKADGYIVFECTYLRSPSTNLDHCIHYYKDDVVRICRASDADLFDIVTDAYFAYSAWVHRWIRI